MELFMAWMMTVTLGVIIGAFFGRSSVRQYETRAEITPLDDGSFRIMTYSVIVKRDNQGAKQHANE